MSYVQKSLLPDEHIVYSAHLHSIIYWAGFGMVVLGGVIATHGVTLIGRFLGPDFVNGMSLVIEAIGGMVVLCGIFMLMGAYIRQSTTELAITNCRIIAKYGFISRNTFEIMLNRVTGSNFEQTIMGRMLGYGTVLVHGAGGDVSPFDIVAEPQNFHKALVGVLEHLQQPHI